MFWSQICVKLLRDEDYCGATGLFVVFDGRSNTLSVGNVGDSRCVLSRQGVAVELTKEHRPTRAVSSGLYAICRFMLTRPYACQPAIACTYARNKFIER